MTPENFKDLPQLQKAKIDKPFYGVSDLAERWGVTMGDVNKGFSQRDVDQANNVPKHEGGKKFVRQFNPFEYEVIINSSFAEEVQEIARKRKQKEEKKGKRATSAQALRFQDGLNRF